VEPGWILPENFFKDLLSGLKEVVRVSCSGAEQHSVKLDAAA